MHNNNIRKLTHTIALVLLTFPMWGCQEDFVHQYCAVESEGWEKKYKARFHITNLKQEREYALTVEARIGKSYPYKDLWLAVETQRNGDIQYDDTVYLKLTDQNEELTGTGRNLLEYHIPVRRMKICPSDTIDLCVRHIMSKESIPGVHDIGVHLK